MAGTPPVVPLAFLPLTVNVAPLLMLMIALAPSATVIALSPFSPSRVSLLATVYISPSESITGPSTTIGMALPFDTVQFSPRAAAIAVAVIEDASSPWISPSDAV